MRTAQSGVEAVSQASLVTGAAGFIGSHVVDRLLSEGRRVIGIDNLSLGRKENLAQAFKNKNFAWLENDVNALDSSRGAIRKVIGTGEIGEIWHLAANSDIQKGVKDPKVDLELTFMTTYHALEIAKEFKIKRFLFSSTSAIYGEHPGLLTEGTGPLLPVSNYGAMKLASEAVISAAAETVLQGALIYRFPNVIGPRLTHGAIHDFFLKLKSNPSLLEVLGNGAQKKPYLHVAELLNAMFFCRERCQDKVGVFNIGVEGSGTTVKSIAESVVHAVSPGARIQYGISDRGWVGDVPRFEYSIEKIKKLGWSPELSSDQSVDRTIRELIENGELL